MSRLQRLVTHRHSATAVVLTACALIVALWRPWQSPATLTAAPESGPALLTSANPDIGGLAVASKPSHSDEPQFEQSIDSLRKAARNVEEADEKPTIIGSWRDDFYGKRIFHFRDDGTAAMTIELDAIGQALYGPKLTFFIDWKIKDDVLILKMTGGDPPSTATVAKIFGESSEQRIESLETNEMKLRSLDSNKLYVHRRVVE